MRPRLTLVALLALGTAMAGTGTALAAPDYGTDASHAQYPPFQTPTNQPEPPGEPSPGPSNLPDPPGLSGPPGPPDGGGGPDLPDRPSEVIDTTFLEPLPLDEQVEQVETGSDALAFTGFAAIPVLLLGVALMGTGLALRRRGQRGD